MAQLKDTIVTGNMRITENLAASSAQTGVLKLPTASGGTTYGVGTNGQVIKSNGTTVYWGTDDSGLELGETSTTAYRGDRGAAAYAAAVTNVDTTPTTSSTNLITSGGVKTAVDDKADKNNPTFTGGMTLGGYEANSEYSAALGDMTTASGENSMAQGYATQAEGFASHSEGGGTTASGDESHSEGIDTYAQGRAAHSEGQGTYANFLAQHVFGQYNENDPSEGVAEYYQRGTYIEMVGNGTSSAYGNRSNARALDWDGNERLKGDLYVGCNADSSGGTKVVASLATQSANGLMSSTDKTKLDNISGENIYYVSGNANDTAGDWTCSITGLTAYFDGLTILFRVVVAGASGGTTININNLGAIPCYTTGTVALTTHYGVGSVILFTYYDNAWRRADYNSNTTYSTLTAAQITTGTATSARVTTAANIKNGVTEAFAAGSTNGAVKLWTKEVTAYTLPIAAANTLGGVKVGSGLAIDANGVLSVNIPSANGVSF